ncbi:MULTISPECIES: hypothetical protein [Legionella]|uniref:Uncharacterized protein n=1 Tax=Legionella drozanskii LLAP-1 TaxID=1212489 RepID=A0A0W0TDS8_9GAMM|nr:MULTISPECIES: hypothetical protein [Legionella]KTC93748.1 hypothetical protein Ldro_0098 [Legionella drozanskii LLAP-1]PJE13594.1 MAG: hypothetical protein CK430_06230 [Legionella sp.]
MFTTIENLSRKQDNLAALLEAAVRDNPEKDRLIALIYTQKKLLEQLSKIASTHIGLEQLVKMVSTDIDLNLYYWSIIMMYYDYYQLQQQSLAANLEFMFFGLPLRKSIENYYLPNLPLPKEKEKKNSKTESLDSKTTRTHSTFFQEIANATPGHKYPQLIPNDRQINIKEILQKLSDELAQMSKEEQQQCYYVP